MRACLRSAAALAPNQGCPQGGRAARLEVRALGEQLGQPRGDRVGDLAPVQAVAVEHAEQRRRAAAQELVRQPRVLRA